MFHLMKVNIVETYFSFTYLIIVFIAKNEAMSIDRNMSMQGCISDLFWYLCTYV